MTRLPPVPLRLAERGIGLRPATEGDGPFLGFLYASTRWEELAPSGWPTAEKTAFLLQQYRLQDAHYTRYYPGAGRGIITAEGEPVGRLWLCAMPGELRIVDVSLLPSHRSRGIGTALLEAVFDLAREVGSAVTIHVEAFNPARHLYDRLGFVEVGGDEVYRKMEWRPA